jgi:hypothetical protein
MKLEVQYISDQLTDGGLRRSNEFYLQQSRLWSKWFGSELLNSFNKSTGKSAFNEKYEAIGNVSFEYAEAQYKFYIQNGMPQEAFPFLKKMFDVNRSTAHHDKICMHMSAAMLSGMYNNFVDIETRKVFQKLARANNFTPVILVRDSRHQKYMRTLMNLATDDDFNRFLSVNGFSEADFNFPNAEKA